MTTVKFKHDSLLQNCVPEEEAVRIFQEFDRDGDGYISANELRDLLSQLGDDVSDIEIQVKFCF